MQRWRNAGLMPLKLAQPESTVAERYQVHNNMDDLYLSDQTVNWRSEHGEVHNLQI